MFEHGGEVRGTFRGGVPVDFLFQRGNVLFDVMEFSFNAVQHVVSWGSSRFVFFGFGSRRFDADTGGVACEPVQANISTSVGDGVEFFSRRTRHCIIQHKKKWTHDVQS